MCRPWQSWRIRCSSRRIYTHKDQNNWTKLKTPENFGWKKGFSSCSDPSTWNHVWANKLLCAAIWRLRCSWNEEWWSLYLQWKIRTEYGLPSLHKIRRKDQHYRHFQRIIIDRTSSECAECSPPNNIYSSHDDHFDEKRYRSGYLCAKWCPRRLDGNLRPEKQEDFSLKIRNNWVDGGSRTCASNSNLNRR